MTVLRSPRPLLPLLLLSSAAALSAQQEKAVAYPDRDLLSPFRTPTEVYAPPDRLFAALRRMRSIAEDPAEHREFDAEGREILDHKAWRAARAEVDLIGIDASYLAGILRMSKNADDRATALYAMFFCKQPEYILNLIGHIPGEPVRKLREQALPRAIAWLQANLGKRFGDLSEEQKKLVLSSMPEIGSPTARAAGIERLPRDEDPLYVQTLRLVPFFQLLDLDEPIDQAQGLWFLKEVFRLRDDLALMWLEPALPRVRQLLVSDDERVRTEAIGLLQAIGPRDLPPVSAAASPATLQDYAERAARRLFPPIRNFNNAIVQLFPSPERDALASAAVAALEGDSLGEPTFGKLKDGSPYRGYRLRHIPEALKALALPAGAVITAVNGVVVRDAASLLQTTRQQLEQLAHPRKLMVEYVRGDSLHAVEYRVL
jgi:hypothetical protein